MDRNELNCSIRLEGACHGAKQQQLPDHSCFSKWLEGYAM